MDEPQEPKMTPFDQMLSDDNLQLLKASIPYAPLQMQGVLSIFAKFKELQHVCSISRRPPAMRMMSQESGTALPEMLQDIGRYTNGNMKETFESLSNTFAMMEMFQTLQATGALQNYNQEGDADHESMDE